MVRTIEGSDPNQAEFILWGRTDWGTVYHAGFFVDKNNQWYKYCVFMEELPEAVRFRQVPKSAACAKCIRVMKTMNLEYLSTVT